MLCGSADIDDLRRVCEDSKLEDKGDFVLEKTLRTRVLVVVRWKDEDVENEASGGETVSEEAVELMLEEVGEVEMVVVEDETCETVDKVEERVIEVG